MFHNSNFQLTQIGKIMFNVSKIIIQQKIKVINKQTPIRIKNNFYLIVYSILIIDEYSYYSQHIFVVLIRVDFIVQSIKYTFHSIKNLVPLFHVGKY